MRPKVTAALSSALALAILTTAALATVTFQAPSIGNWVPRGASASAVADFDGDGLMDLAVGSEYPLGYITLLKGTGQGRFVAVDSIPMGQAEPIHMQAVDLDLDGKPDLVLDSYLGTRVLRGMGGFSFEPAVKYTVGGTRGGSPDGLAVGDLFGDARPEVVTPDTVGALVVWQVVGDATLVPAVQLPVGGLTSYLVAADLDQDGDLDIVDDVVVGGAHFLKVFRNDGGGAFALTANIAVNNRYGIAIADLDGDGIRDIVHAAEFLRGLGGCAFDPPVLFGGSQEDLPLTADLNGDGHPDLLSVDYSSPSPLYPTSLRVRFGTGSGVGPPHDWSGPWSIFDLDCADFDQDGRLDVLATGYSGGQLALYFGDGNEPFVLPRQLRTGGPTGELRVADVDENGVPDVLALLQTQNKLRIFQGLGGAAFADPIDLAVPAASVGCDVGDVDDDGHPDLLVLSGATLWLQLGLGGGAFGAPIGYPLPGTALALTVGEVTGDGRFDVIVGCQAPNITSVYPGTNGSGLGTRMDFPVAGFTSSYFCFPRIGDVNGDDVPDVVIGASRDYTESAHSFATNVLMGPVHAGTVPVYNHLFSSVYPAYGFELVDFDGDDRDDICFNWGLYNFAYLTRGLSDGAGLFVMQPTLLNVTTWTPGMTSADFDNDGRRDLAFVHAYSAGATVRLLQPSGAFGPPECFGAGSPDDYTVRLAAHDLNGDGLPDIVTAGDSTLTILLQTGGGVLDVPAVAPAVAPPSISQLWPTLAKELVRVRFTVPRRAEAFVELFDVAGRRVTRTSFGVMEPGTHQRDVGLPRSIEPGVFWLRLSQDNHRAVARAVIAR